MKYKIPIIRKGEHRFALLMLIVSLFVGCTPDPISTPIATLPLSPVLPTSTSLPPTETPTVEPRLSPADLTTPTPQDSSAQILNFVRNDMQMRLNSGDIIEDITIVPMRWEQSSTLGCDPSTLPNIRRIDGFWVLVTAGEQVYDYHTDTGQLLVLCAIYPTHNLPVDVRLLIDPLAVELVALAQRRLATQFDIIERRVLPIEITPYTWSDTSLGCPDPRQTYVEQTIDGFRMVLQVGDALYAFHTDSERIAPCPLGQEVLPSDISAESTPDDV